MLAASPGRVPDVQCPGDPGLVLLFPNGARLMAARLTPADPASVAAALAATEPTRTEVRLLVKHFLAVLEARAPGRSVEVRIPPYAAVQVIPGVRHTRGTPPAVVETDAATWIALATGALTWQQAVEGGTVRASGERTDLTTYLPLT